MLGSFFVKTINDSDDKVDASVTVKDKERNTSPQSTEIVNLFFIIVLSNEYENIGCRNKEFYIK